MHRSRVAMSCQYVFVIFPASRLHHLPILPFKALRCPFFGPLAGRTVVVVHITPDSTQFPHCGCLSHRSFRLRHSSHAEPGRWREEVLVVVDLAAAVFACFSSGICKGNTRSVIERVSIIPPLYRMRLYWTRPEIKRQDKSCVRS